jgi:pyruvate/2-oxoglutarate dehydrogenase complex dihydrolipoamide dehydrogenase (E3) component
VKVIRGVGKFVGAKTVTVETEDEEVLIGFDDAIIATGSDLLICHLCRKILEL